METRRRSLAKSVGYRPVSVITAAVIIWIITGSLWQSFLAAVVIEAVHQVWYVFYERVWSHIKWGYKLEQAEK